MDSFKIILPFPPSSNTAYPTVLRGKKVMRVKSKKLVKWIKDAPRIDYVKVHVPCTISYLMFFPDNRARDGQNYMKVLTDYLVSEGVFADDNWRNIVGEQWFSGGIDRENPRVEITIREYKK